MFNGFYKGKRVFVTGHTGFKGSWLSLWLKQLGAEVVGYSLSVPTALNLYDLIGKETFYREFEGDIRDALRLHGALKETQPDFVFHLAAQPLVRESYKDPFGTLEVNALGTARLLDAIRNIELPCDIVVITTDKCYENREWHYAYREVEPLGGHDVYSASKAAAEIIVQSWNRSFFQPNPKLGKLVTVRAGNVIGGGDYAPDRILPDCIRALNAKQPIVLRNPHAVRPWQHVLECLSGYLWVGAKLANEKKDSLIATPFNFGPESSSTRTVQALVQHVFKTWPGEWIDGSGPNAPHEAKLLTLSIEKAAALLKWHPAWDFETAVRESVSWYKERHIAMNRDMIGVTLSQIDAYSEAARQKNIEWTRL